MCATGRRLLGVVLQRARALLPQPQGLARRPGDGRRRPADGRRRQGRRAVHGRPGTAPPRPDDRRGGSRASASRSSPARSRPTTTSSTGPAPCKRSNDSPNGGVLVAEELREPGRARRARSRSTSAAPQDVEWAIAGGQRLPAAVATRDDAVSRSLDQRRASGSSPYWNAQHLERTRDWLLVLEPKRSRGARDRRAHARHGAPLSRRAVDGSRHDGARRRRPTAAPIPSDLRGSSATGSLARAPPRPLVAEVERLILAHEIGGIAGRGRAPGGRLALVSRGQRRARRRAGSRDGRCSRERSKEQLAYMFDRIRVVRATELALPLYEQALGPLMRPERPAGGSLRSWTRRSRSRPSAATRRRWSPAGRSSASS